MAACRISPVPQALGLLRARSDRNLRAIFSSSLSLCDRQRGLSERTRCQHAVGLFSARSAFRFVQRNESAANSSKPRLISRCRPSPLPPPPLPPLQPCPCCHSAMPSSRPAHMSQQQAGTVCGLPLEGGSEDSLGDYARFGIVTVSDRASGGVYEDQSGPAILQFFHEAIKSK